MNGAHVTAPQVFQWDGHNAAYYTLSSGTGVVTVLVAVALPGNTLLIVNVSAPSADRQRLRQQLPTALARIEVGEHTLNGNYLTELPLVLRFPAEDVSVFSGQPPG